MLILAFVIASCGIQISKESNISLEKIFKINSTIENLEFSGSVSVNQRSQSFSANIVTKIAAADSVQMKVKMLGMELGRMYSDRNEFKFFNILENRVYEGEPSDDNFYDATKIKVSFDDIVYMFKGLPPGGIKGFIYSENYELDDDLMMFKRTRNKDYVEYLILSKSTNSIRLYQRKDSDGELVLNTSYTDYIQIEGYSLANIIKIKMNALDSEIVFDIDEIKINPIFTTPFDFNVPLSVKRYKYFGE